MKLPIDIIWIRGNVVVGMTENAQPELGKSDFALKTYSPPEPVDAVLEVPAGTVVQLGIKAGDEISLSL